MRHTYQIDRKAPDNEGEPVPFDDVAPIAAMSAGRFAEREGLGLPKAVSYSHSSGRSTWTFWW